MSSCPNPRYKGPELAQPCEVVPGGTPVIQAPRYGLVVQNSPLQFDCDFWIDDDQQMVLESNSDFICIDNAA